MSATSATALHHAQILIVDDQEPNVLLLEAMLEQAGYTNLHSLVDARGVLSWCEAHPPDLILLDLQMPHVDGLSLLEQMQSLYTPETYPPILVLTADVALDTKRRALSIGARDFVTKPFDRPEVLLRVKNLLQSRALYLQSRDQTQVLEAQLRDRSRDLAHAVAERRDMTVQLQRQAHHDPLTDLPNRVLLQERLHDAVRTTQDGATSLALLLVDIARFKEVNDSLGYQGGDLLLREVARRVQSSVRRANTVARLGSDEFAVLIPGIKVASAIWAARKLLMAFAEPVTVDGLPLQMGAHIGIVVAPDHGVDVSTLLRRAEAAVSAAQRGESGYAVYTTDQDQRDPQRLILAGELQQAIAHNQLTLEYQPQVDLKTGRTCGVEALVRWNHPRLGRMAPDRFIALAEQSGAIMGLTEWVVDAALAQQRAWRQMGLELNVAVNLSMRTLHNAQLPRAIAAVVQRYGIAPERVTLEITESALMEDHGRVREVLTQLAAMGLRLSIDDFGTGYSSLGYLSRLPVHELKIDRSFVREMMTSRNDATIVQSVIDLGHKLGLQVVAEGVEQRTEWSIMGDWACDVVQGYYLSRPLGATDLERWLLTSPYGMMQA